MASAEILQNYNIERQVYPAQTDQAMRTPIVLLEPFSARAQATIGYDMFSQQDRRIAMEAAAKNNSVVATAPVILRQEITSDMQMGFLLYLPVKLDGSTVIDALEGTSKLAGFVYAPYRVGDLHKASLKGMTSFYALVTSDITDTEQPVVIYESPDLKNVLRKKTYSAERFIKIAGRDWKIEVYKISDWRNNTSTLLALSFSAISLILATSIAAYARSQIKALSAVQALKKVSDKSVQEKDMMLQEMKHRIKNAIARINAISRQTARNSASVEEFSQTLSARLQAMANAQDMLTRSSWAQADLRALLQVEFEQLFGNNSDRISLSGADVLLNESQTQAFGLVFHELGTNAMKYGCMSDDEGKLCVRWWLAGEAKKRHLHINWEESFEISETSNIKNGFGTKLIEANIMSELGGSFERRFSENGMQVLISIPWQRK